MPQLQKQGLSHNVLITKRWITQVPHVKQNTALQQWVGPGHQHRPWGWCLEVVLVSGVWVEPESGLAPGLWLWPGWALTLFAQAGAWAGLPQRSLLAMGYPTPSTRKFWKSSFSRSHEQLRPTGFPTISVIKFQKCSFWRLREGMRPRDFPTFPSESVARIRFDIDLGLDLSLGWGLGEGLGVGPGACGFPCLRCTLFITPAFFVEAFRSTVLPHSACLGLKRYVSPQSLCCTVFIAPDFFAYAQVRCTTTSISLRLAVCSAGLVRVKTTPRKTRFRDVKYARVWDTD